jgi:diguanylate cyclase (GGDEF)-like protein
VSVVLDLALVPGGPDVAVVARDVTADREASDRLTHRALHDPLTGLANRALLLSTLQEALERPGAEDRMAVLACDLDGFKPINDRYGHAAGDDVLVHVASVMRAATGSLGTVARLGGDEFVILLEAADSARAAQEVAGAIHAGLREPVRIQRHRVPVRASVGVALGSSPTPSAGAPGLLAAADTALYRAKGGGRSRTEVYDPAVDHDGAPVGLAAELAGALDRGEIVVHLQPVVDLVDRRVVGDEALLRWQHPDRGLLPPAVFGSAVPEAGMTAALARHVLGRAVDHLARTSGTGRWIAVDVAVELLGDGELVRALLDELAARGAQPGRLVVELGGTALDDVAHRVRVDLAALRAAGVRVVLDRFGAGLPPLASLRDLPVDGIKLDPSYTSGVVDDPAAARVARGVAALARELGLMTVADGVDTAEQADVLRGAGWRYAQGWASGGPQPAA